MKKLIFAAALALVGCTDATRSNLGSLGSEAQITCYSGGQAVFKDSSTGKIEASNSGAGLFFRSKTTGSFVRAYADCIVISE